MKKQLEKFTNIEDVLSKFPVFSEIEKKEDLERNHEQKAIDARKRMK